MKKQYRVNVPAVIAFYVAAESEEQAKRIAAAACYTPVEPMFTNGTWENHGFESAHVIGLTVWAATYDKDGTIGGIDGELTGAAVEVIDVNAPTEDEILDLEQGVREFAAFNSNEAELEAALAYDPAAEHKAEQTEAFNKYGMQV